MAGQRRQLGRSRISCLPLLNSDLTSQSIQMVASRFELIIFDCDGVLVDSEPIINRAHAQVLTACGYSITKEALVERFCGMSDSEMLDIIKHEWGRALPGSYAARVGEMTAIGFSGGSHCGPEHAAHRHTRGAKLVIANMRELAAAMPHCRRPPI